MGIVDQAVRTVQARADGGVEQVGSGRGEK